MHHDFRRVASLIFAFVCLFSLRSVSFAGAEDTPDLIKSKASVVVFSNGEWLPLELINLDDQLCFPSSDDSAMLDRLEQSVAPWEIDGIPQFTLTDEFACQLILEAPFSKCYNNCLIYRQDGDRLIPTDGDYNWKRLDGGKYLIVVSFYYEQSGHTYSGQAPFWLQVPDQTVSPASSVHSSDLWLFDCISVSVFADGEWKAAHNATRWGYDRGIMYDDLLAFGMSIEEYARCYESDIPQFVLTDEFICHVAADTPFIETDNSIHIYRLNGSELTCLDGVSDWTTLKKGRYLVDVECYISRKDSEYNTISTSDSYFSGARLFWLLIGVSPTPASKTTPTAGPLTKEYSTRFPLTSGLRSFSGSLSGYAPVLVAVLCFIDAILLILIIRKKK